MVEQSHLASTEWVDIVSEDNEVIAQASRDQETFIKRYRYSVDRLAFKDRTARTALELIRRRLLGLNQDA